MKWDQINGIIEFEIKCSAGTYIRAIARDLGETLNSEGWLHNLKEFQLVAWMKTHKNIDIAKEKKTQKI